MKNNRLYFLLTFFALLWAGVAWSQERAIKAEPEAARAAMQDPGGIGRGLQVPRLIKLSGALKTVTGTPLPERMA
jgi:hypothetical protein